MVERPRARPGAGLFAGRGRGRAGSQAGPAGSRAGGAVRRVRVLAPRDAGRLAAGGAGPRGRSSVAAMATCPLAGLARSAGPLRGQGDGHPARVLRPDAGGKAPTAARGAPVRDLVRRAPLRLDLRDAGARDGAARLHPQPQPRVRWRRAGGVRAGRFAALGLGAAGARQRPAAHGAGRRRGRRALRRPAVRRARDAAGGFRRRCSSAGRSAADRARRRRQPHACVPCAESAPGAGDDRRRDLGAHARRRDAALHRRRGRRAGRRAPSLPAARAGGVRGGLRLPHTIVDLPRPAGAADPRRGRPPAGAAARLARAAGSAARGDAPGRRARASPTSIPRDWLALVRGARDRPRRRPGRSGRELPDARSDQLGPGAAAAGAGRVSVRAPQRRGAPVPPRRRGGPAVRSAARAGAGRPGAAGSSRAS